MKVIYYVIHHTHTIHHVNRSMRSFHEQQHKLRWDKLVIKNSIPDQISNDTVKGVMDQYRLSDVFNSIEFVSPGQNNTTYSDLKDAIFYGQNSNADFLLFTKAEYCYSEGSFGVFEGLFAKPDDTNWVFTPPIVNVTEIGTSENICKKLNETTFNTNDALTGYDGDDLHRLPSKRKPEGLFNRILYRIGLKERPFFGDISNRKIDERMQYQFIAHNVVLDINVHVFDKLAINEMEFSNEEINLKWGRIRALDRLLEKGTKFVINHKCFSIHLFHEIPGARMGRNINGIRY